ncbi:hypothetical protein Q5M47_13185 [Acinetobacter nosocomialis]|nr:hypothetical protein [Acinetobacter nosocomialis]MDO7216349.1 hypothetical protein [Acinetobacter nosocomialis]
MDDRNLELEAWLIETAGEEMMANHLGSNWNKFNEEFGFYPNMAMTVADLVWQHQQAKVEELQKKVDESNKGMNFYFNLAQENGAERNELQKRVDAVKQLIQDYLDEEKELELKEWEQSTISGRIAIELEQALKGEA